MGEQALPTRQLSFRRSLPIAAEIPGVEPRTWFDTCPGRPTIQSRAIAKPTQLREDSPVLGLFLGALPSQRRRLCERRGEFLKKSLSAGCPVDASYCRPRRRGRDGS